MGEEWSEPSAVVLGRAFIGYACQNSLVCCRSPTRAPVLPQDLPRIRGALCGANAPLAEAFEASLEDFVGHGAGPEGPADQTTPEPLFQVVAQTSDGRCTQLDPTGACTLHRAGGLMALPGPCRTFPRSIIALPDGRWEIAFAVRCPTAAGLLAAAPGAAELVEAPGVGWSRYPPHRAFAAESRPDERADRWSALQALRGAWSEVLAGARDGAAVVDALGALSEDPTRPRRAPEVPVSTLGDGLSGARLFQVTRALETLPERGSAWVRLRWHLWAGLQQPHSPERLARMADASPLHVTALAATWLSWAGVHDVHPFEAGARLAAARAVTALRLHATIETLLRLPTWAAWTDAYVASSYDDVPGRAPH